MKNGKWKMESTIYRKKLMVEIEYLTSNIQHLTSIRHLRSKYKTQTYKHLCKYKHMNTHATYIFVLMAFLIGHCVAASAQSPGAVAQTPQEEAHYGATEKVFVRTDRDMYVSGEELYYAVTLIQEKDDATDPSVLAYMLIQNEAGEVLEGIAVPLSGNAGNGSMYIPDTLSTGFYRLMAYTNEMRNFSPNGYFKKKLFVANRFCEQLDPIMDLDVESLQPNDNNKDADFALSGSVEPDHMSLKISVEKDVYGRRELVCFNVKKMLPASTSIQNVSVAVVPDFALWPFLRNNKEEKQPAEYMTNAYIHYPRETSGPVITGVLKKQNGEPPDNRYRVLLSTPDSITAMQYSVSGSNGVFNIRPDKYFLGRPLYLTLDQPDVYDGLEIDVEDKFDVTIPFEAYTGSIPRGLPAMVRKSQDVVTVKKAYELMQPPANNPGKQQHQYPRRLYSQPVRTVVPANFVALDDFREIARELIPTLRVRSQRNDLQIRLLNNQTAYTFFDRPPAIFINNLPLGNFDELMKLSSDDIRRIEVHNTPWRFGRMQFDGILSVFTYDLPDAYNILPTPFAQIPPLIPQEKRTYETPDHNKKNNETARIPDFRQLLFWQPDVQIHHTKVHEASFFTGDLGGIYIIYVKGYTEDGRLVQGSRSFKVKLD